MCALYLTAISMEYCNMHSLIKDTTTIAVTVVTTAPLYLSKVFSCILLGPQHTSLCSRQRRHQNSKFIYEELRSTVVSGLAQCHTAAGAEVSGFGCLCPPLSVFNSRMSPTSPAPQCEVFLMELAFCGLILLQDDATPGTPNKHPEPCFRLPLKRKRSS